MFRPNVRTSALVPFVAAIAPAELSVAFALSRIAAMLGSVSAGAAGAGGAAAVAAAAAESAARAESAPESPLEQAASSAAAASAAVDVRRIRRVIGPPDGVVTCHLDPDGSVQYPY